MNEIRLFTLVFRKYIKSTCFLIRRLLYIIIIFFNNNDFIIFIFIYNLKFAIIILIYHFYILNLRKIFENFNSKISIKIDIH